MESRRRKKLMSDINVVPYIDVMLVLLVIFMVTSPLQQQGLEIDLPIAKGKPIQSDETPTLIISVKKNGKYYISENAAKPKLVSQQTLVEKVVALHHNKPNMQVYVRGDKSVKYGDVVDVMAGLKQSGIARIGLITTLND